MPDVAWSFVLTAVLEAFCIAPARLWSGPVERRSTWRSVPSAFAMQAQLHVALFGTTREQMALVTVKNRKNGALNPRCHSSH